MRKRAEDEIDLVLFSTSRRVVDNEQEGGRL
jgi:hypothetical protein